ncbi:hypothetical protein BDV96DRAFT_595903 [Lophiotrema nucula]|uniref:Cyclase-domain-containing protein n=1 Tax=Lophiotrema nucula TaxID=690887 RepID=A0A6A5ZLU5_9PLEO|nr:hypothetical protein BDV96DRAFT_595903 [Lophiotrema nucula]
MLLSIRSTALLAIGLSTATVLPDRKRLVSRQYDTSNPYANWPSYADLPLDSSYPTKAAWGVWGADDVHGALNHITNDTRRQAASEIQTGKAFNLNLELSFMPRPINGERRPLVHLFQPGDGYTDDVMTINTQMSTQFDGLRHFAYSTDGNSSTYQYYNDLIPDYDHVVGWNYTSVLGIQQAAEKGIAARGVLLDYKAWMDARNQTYNPLSTWSVHASELQQVAEWQGLPSNFSRPGDILVVRFGWLAAYGQLNETEKQELVLGPGNYIGLIANEESAEWLWNQKFAIVGADNPAFEEVPFSHELIGGVYGRSLHQVMISGWGQNILEFIDCEKLAPALRAQGRSTFFITVQPVNKNGGIASPPNAMAII